MGREPGDKALIAIAVELNEQGLGRIRLKRIADASAESLGQFVQRERLKQGATLRTDGWRGYWPMARRGYTHEPTKRKDVAEEETDVRGPIASWRCSNAGFWAPTKARCSPSTWTTISTSSPSASIVGPPGLGESCSTGSWNRPFRSSPAHTKRSFAPTSKWSVESCRYPGVHIFWRQDLTTRRLAGRPPGAERRPQSVAGRDLG